MTLPTTSNRMAYTGNGATTVYPYVFLILAANDLQVYVNTILKTLNTDYSISGVGNNGGGNVTFVTAPANGAKIVFLRATDLTQEVDLQEGSKLPSDVVEVQLFDRIYAIVQDLVEKVQRAPLLGPASTLAGSQLALPEPVALRVLRWNASATALELVTILSTDIASPIAAPGDLIQGGATGAAERLVVGTTGDLLQVIAGQAAWRSLANTLLTLLTVNGDLLYRDGSGVVNRLPIGSAGQQLQVSSGLPTWVTPVSTRITGERVNLVVKHDATNPAFKLTITADALDVQGYRVTSLNVSPDLTAVGANGLDNGGEAANTHYFVWVIAKSSDSAATPAGLFSTSATAPTMPSGYDLKRLVSHRRNDGSSNFIRAMQSNDLVLGDWGVMQAATSLAVDTDVALTSYVPVAIADMVLVGLQQGDGSVSGDEWQIVDKDDASIQYGRHRSNGAAGMYQFWARQNASGVITLDEVSGATTMSVFVMGWRVKVL